MTKFDRYLNVGLWLYSFFIVIAFTVYIYIIENNRKIDLVKSNFNSNLEQIAQIVSFPLKIKDFPTINRLMHKSVLIKKVLWVNIYDNNKNNLFSYSKEFVISENVSIKQKPKVLSHNCKYEYLRKNIKFKDEVIGEIDYCFKMQSIPELGHVGAIASGAGILIFAITLALFITGRRKSRPIIEFLNYIEKIDPTLGVIKSSLPEVKDSDIRKLYSKTNSLITRLQELNKIEKENEKSTTITRITQMLAHDVRKPFTMLESILQIFCTCSNISQFKKEAKESIPEVKRAIKIVNGMLHDILEINSKTELHLEAVIPESLIEMVIIDSLRYQEEANIELEYFFNHKFQVEVDHDRVMRVFSNIFGNALQAMDYNGRIWFVTEDIVYGSKKFIKITIGNNRSYIASNDKPLLFDAFFTKGKKKGTGLGLAISKKIIEAHGGKIWCESSQQKQCTEFIFTLPSSSYKIDKKFNLPKSSSQILKHYQTEKYLDFEEHSFSVELEELVKEKNLHDIIKKNKIEVKILIVDDEKIYRSSTKNLLKSLSDIGSYIHFFEASNSREAIKIATKTKPDLILLDVDLGELHKNGFDVGSELRQLGYEGIICIHSNRGFREYHQIALESGADTFLPKPISKIHLLKLIEDSIKGYNSTPQKDPIEAKNKFIILDDTPIYLKNWKLLKEVDAILFRSPEEFWSAYQDNPLMIERAKAIITDYFFDNSRVDGMVFAKVCQKRGIKLPIFLATDADVVEDDIKSSAIELKVPKKAYEAYHMILNHQNQANYRDNTNKSLEEEKKPLSIDEPINAAEQHEIRSFRSRHEFKRLKNGIRDYLGFFNSNVLDDENERLELRDYLLNYLPIIENEKRAISKYPQKEILDDILKIAHDSIVKTYDVMANWPPMKDEKQEAIAILMTAKTKLAEYQNYVNNLK